MGAQLENFPGNLRQAYEQIKRGTGRHVDQLTTERRTNHELRSLTFYTVDGNIYRLDRRGKPEWDITRELTNPVLGNLNVACQQLLSERNYHPSQEEVWKALRARSTVKVDPTKLRLERHDDEFSILRVPTEEYDALPIEERKVAERVYGQGNDFVANMRMLAEEGKISVASVFVLNPDYVEREAKRSALGRASWLYYFNVDSDFNAADRNVYDHSRLRGVRRVVAAGDAPQNPKVPSAAQAPSEIRAATIEEILAFTKAQGYIAPKLWDNYESEVRRRMTQK